MKKIKKLFFLLIIAFVLVETGYQIYYYVQDKENILDKLVNKEMEKIEISLEGEENSNIIAKYFIDGISKEDYLEIFKRKVKSLKETKKYKKIEYDFETHLTYNELEDIYKNLNNSEIVKTEIIGSSVDGRNIYSLEIGKGNKTILFEVGIHAAEIANPLFITKFMIDLVNKYEENDEEIIELLNEYKIVVLPSVNPDGYETAVFGVDVLNNKNLFSYKNKEKIDFHYFKANANGIDINRNFPSQNGGLHYKKYDLINSVSLTPSTERLRYYGGESLGSEPETKALIYWQNKYLETTYAYIALHSSGRVIYAGKPNLSNEFNNLCNKCAKIVHDITDYTVLGLEYEEVGEGNDGTATDFMAELASGFKYSSKTGRLSTASYDSKTKDLKHKLCVITVETLERFTKDLGVIKDEYVNYKLEKVFLNLIKQ